MTFKFWYDLNCDRKDPEIYRGFSTLDKMTKVGILGAAALIGAGLAALSEERIREFVKEKVDTGALSKEEGKILVEDLVSETKKQRLDLEKNIVEKIRATVLKSRQATCEPGGKDRRNKDPGT